MLHPSDDDLRDYCLGTAVDDDAIEAHLNECGECARKASLMMEQTFAGAD